MTPEVARAREELELARATAARLWAEISAEGKNRKPSPVATPEEVRRLGEASEWQARVQVAEHELFRAEHGTPGIVGSRGDYQWLTMAERDITSLLRICPEIVVGKYLAVTSIDSGPLRLTEEERRQGWWTSEAGRFFQGTSWNPPVFRDEWKVAYSPRIASIHGLPNETHEECCAGFDEWYVFDGPVEAGDIESFVNWGGFRLYDPEFEWCTERFWSQMERTQPESYIAEGTVFMVVTRDAGLFRRVISGYLEQGA